MERREKSLCLHMVILKVKLMISFGGEHTESGIKDRKR